MERVDLPPVVHDVPTYEEFFGLLDNQLDDSDFDTNVKDEDIKKIILVALSLLQDFYIEIMYYNEFDVLREDFEKKLNDFQAELKEIVLSMIKEYLEDIHADLNNKYEIPVGTVESEIDIAPVIISGIDAAASAFTHDIQNKSDFYKLPLTTGVFALEENIRLFARKITNVINFNAQHANKCVIREFELFVYGQDALATWNVTGVNTCAWCYYLASLGARPLSWFPVDHINGGCWLEILNPNEYSDEYKKIRVWI